MFQPSSDEPLDFEQTIEKTLIALNQKYQIRKILFDPWQMQATAQRLRQAGLPIEEFPQSQPNLTSASQNLYELIQGGLVAYPEPAIRLAISRAIAVETARGWRISKQSASHKVDVVVALAMAAHAAVQSQARCTAVTVRPMAGDGGADDWYQLQRSLYFMRETMAVSLDSTDNMR